MKISKKFISVIFTILSVCLIGNIIYYKYHVIDEPLFLRHYYDITEGLNNFNLYYLQDINSDDKIASIQFPEIGNGYVSFSESVRNNDNRYNNIICVYITLYNFASDSQMVPQEYKNKIITKIKVTFSSGKCVTENIGKIYLYKDKEEKSQLQWQGVTGSSDNTGMLTYKANSDIYIDGISSDFDKAIKGDFQININDKTYTHIINPIKLNTNDPVYITYSFGYNNAMYFFPINISTETPDGKKGITQSMINSQVPIPENVDINSLREEDER